MSEAVSRLLAKTNVQVLWKFKSRYTLPNAVSAPSIHPDVADRVRTTGWLTVDPYALLETGNIVASVHHGGANCYHEAIA